MRFIDWLFDRKRALCGECSLYERQAGLLMGALEASRAACDAHFVEVQQLRALADERDGLRRELCMERMRGAEMARDLRERYLGLSLSMAGLIHGNERLTGEIRELRAEVTAHRSARAATIKAMDVLSERAAAQVEVLKTRLAHAEAALREGMVGRDAHTTGEGSAV